ncbi:cobyric acid synthase [Proteiniclasticum sp. SCR006]|uniref:Cobyric acid synthase n=2 Tax=Proteiniclasticum aestuarii TaxID=2817862 RepID=A0A939KEJ4_9CLOT|nr:cobyric acid synthase [Proteiniclasticum aestuarii]
MVQGTSSSVGKSVLAAALCRIFTQDGYSVSPFKSQNMSLNSHVTTEGHEMGRAQVLQAQASRKAPHVSMNPILLKPTTDQKSQVIVMGKAVKNMKASDYFRYKHELKDLIVSAYGDLSERSDIMVIEGAGSPAEINLRADDIVNMGFAEMVDAPVILVADIDRGGVFASIYGTVMLLEEAERNRIKGVIINKFRGDPSLLTSGIEELERLIRIPVLGVIPFFSLDLDEEDSAMDLMHFRKDEDPKLDIAVIRVPHLSNFTDFQPLSALKEVSLRFVGLHEEIGHPDLIILPGTKSTMEDLQKMKESGMDERVLRSQKAGTPIMGICGGYQMLGERICDSYGVETDRLETEGLGLLRMETRFEEEKKTFLVEGISPFGEAKISGYEIHMGESRHKVKYSPLLTLTKRSNEEVHPLEEGVMDREQGIFGTYVHGIFENAGFTRSLLDYLCTRKGISPLEETITDYWDHREKELDKLAQIVREHTDMEKIYAILAEN